MQRGSEFHYRLLDVEIGEDQDGEMITSATVTETVAPIRKQKISPDAKVAYQALPDVIAHHGEKRCSGNKFLTNRFCVSVERWKDECANAA